METDKENRIPAVGTDNKLFRVPDHYFDQLPLRIMEQVENKQIPGKGFLFIRYLKPALGLVAGFLLIFGLVYVPMKYISPLSTAKSNSIIIDEEYYITSNMDDRKIFETLEDDSPETLFDNNELENLLLGSVNEYELIVLNN